MKESTVFLQLRLRDMTHAKLKCIAQTELRSLNAQIEYFLLQSIDKYEAEHGALEPKEGDISL